MVRWDGNSRHNVPITVHGKHSGFISTLITSSDSGVDLVESSTPATTTLVPLSGSASTPNGFLVDSVHMHVSRKIKNKQLLAVIQNTQVFEGTQLIYMYYDVVNGLPAICLDPAYDAVVKAMIVPPIIQ